MTSRAFERSFGHRRDVCVAVVRRIPVPAAALLAVLHDARLLALYEPKVSTVTQTPAPGQNGTYVARGHLSRCVRWNGAFSYEVTPQGFRSRSLDRIGGMDVSGEFFVESAGPFECEVCHEERYTLPPSWRLVRSPFTWLVTRTMRGELEALERLARTRPMVGTAVGRPRAVAAA